MLIIGRITNGIKNIGFKIIGAPNNAGSLTWNQIGMYDAIPTAFKRFDLQNKMKRIGITNVAPVPPNVDVKSYENSYVNAQCGCNPWANKVWLFAKFEYINEVKNERVTEGP